MLEMMLRSSGIKTWPPDDLFHGEVPSSNFITPQDLASATALTTGGLANDGTTWLSFTLDGAELMIPKLPIRTGVTWNDLNAAGLVTGKIVSIRGANWLVRLIRGGTVNPVPNQTGNDPSGSSGSEWNRTMYHITNVRDFLTSEGLVTGDKEQYSNAELGVGVGFRNLCQETITGYPALCLHRGSTHISHFGGTNKGNGFHWRPVLELIP